MSGNTKTATMKVFLAALVFSFSGLMSKWMPWGALSMVGGRAVIAALIIGLYRKSFRVKLTRGVVLGGLSVMLTSVLFLMANKLTTAANAIVLQYAMPIFVIALCAIFFHQKPSRMDVIAVVFVLAGIALCFSDNLGGGAMSGNLLAILSAVTYALVFFAARLDNCNPFDYTYLGNLISSVFLINLFFDPAVSAAPMPWVVCLLMGIMLAGGYLLLSGGVKDVAPVTAAIVSNIEPVLNPIWVFLALGEQPGIRAILGAAVVLVTVTIYSARMRSKGASEN